MNKWITLAAVVFLLASCGSGPKQQDQTAESQNEQSAALTVYSVDELMQNAAAQVDKEVVVKGTVMHVCQHGGQRCFLMGSTEDINIRVEAGEKIGTFSQELMGSDLEITGILREVKTEADAHNPGQHHGEGEADEDSVTARAHKIIAEAQEEAETVYFIDGLQIRSK